MQQPLQNGKRIIVQMETNFLAQGSTVLCQYEANQVVW